MADAGIPVIPDAVIPPAGGSPLETGVEAGTGPIEFQARIQAGIGNSEPVTITRLVGISNNEPFFEALTESGNRVPMRGSLLIDPVHPERHLGAADVDLMMATFGVNSSLQEAQALLAPPRPGNTVNTDPEERAAQLNQVYNNLRRHLVALQAQRDVDRVSSLPPANEALLEEGGSVLTEVLRKIVDEDPAYSGMTSEQKEEIITNEYARIESMLDRQTNQLEHLADETPDRVPRDESVTSAYSAEVPRALEARNILRLKEQIREIVHAELEPGMTAAERAELVAEVTEDAIDDILDAMPITTAGDRRAAEGLALTIFEKLQRSDASLITEANNMDRYEKRHHYEHHIIERNRERERRRGREESLRHPRNGRSPIDVLSEDNYLEDILNPTTERERLLRAGVALGRVTVAAARGVSRATRAGARGVRRAAGATRRRVRSLRG